MIQREKTHTYVYCMYIIMLVLPLLPFGHNFSNLLWIPLLYQKHIIFQVTNKDKISNTFFLICLIKMWDNHCLLYLLVVLQLWHMFWGPMIWSSDFYSLAVVSILRKFSWLTACPLQFNNRSLSKTDGGCIGPDSLDDIFRPHCDLCLFSSQSNMVLFLTGLLKELFTSPASK